MDNIRQQQYDAGDSDSYHNRVMHRRTAETHAAFFTSYLRSGMSLLDCGCGPGTITVGLAELVSPANVVGVDIGANDIENATALARSHGVANVEFRPGSVYEIPYPDNSFDAAFAHGLLEHLTEPMDALAEMCRVLKPGGIIGVRIPDYDGHFYAPNDPLIDESLDLIERVVVHNGGSRRIGKHLRAMLREAGFVRVIGSSYSEFNGTPEETLLEADAMAAVFAGHFLEQVVSLGWASAGKLRSMASAWKAWGANPDSFRASAWCEAVGWKE